MSIRDWPDGERPREKLAARGAWSLSDANCSQYSSARVARVQSAVDLAAVYCRRAGTQAAARGHRHGNPDSAPWPGAACRAAPRSRPPLPRAELREADSLTDPAASAATSSTTRATLPNVKYLPACSRQSPPRDRVRGTVRGSIDGASVHPREVVRHCLAHNAAAVIFAHNHRPAWPSQAARIVRSPCDFAMRSRSSTCACSIISSSAAGYDFVARRGWI